MIEQVEFKRCYYHKIHGLTVLAFPVLLAPYFMYAFAQKDDRLAPVLIFGKGMIYFNPRINLDFCDFSSGIYHTMYKIYGKRIIREHLMQLLLPLMSTSDNYKYRHWSTLTMTAYRYERKDKEEIFIKHDWKNIAPYWWDQKQLALHSSQKENKN